jgi:hypothetical protein
MVIFNCSAVIYIWRFVFLHGTGTILKVSTEIMKLMSAVYYKGKYPFFERVFLEIHCPE